MNFNVIIFFFFLVTDPDVYWNMIASFLAGRSWFSWLTSRPCWSRALLKNGWSTSPYLLLVPVGFSPKPV